MVSARKFGRLAAVTALSLYLTAWPGCGHPAPAQDGIAFDAVNATCRIKRPVDSNRFVVGSGVAFDETADGYLVLSNHHVTNRGRSLKIDFFDNGFITDPNEPASASASYLGNGLDVSVTEVSKADLAADQPVIPLAEPGYEPEPGETVIMIGCSDGRWPRARVGHVEKVEGGRIYYLPTSIGGDSGSAVFNRDCTKVIGLTTWSNGRQGIAQTVDSIRAGMEAANKPKPPAQQQPNRPYRFWGRSTDDIATTYSNKPNWQAADAPAYQYLTQETNDDQGPDILTPREQRRLLERLRHDCERIEKNQRNLFPILSAMAWFIRVCFWVAVVVAVLVVLGHPLTAWIVKTIFTWAAKGIANIKDAVDGDNA